uniref:Glycosyltransferase n=1 Tax=Oryza barthii TaxID=65489 RepID=A0A0D3HE45_9ORYZ
MGQQPQDAVAANGNGGGKRPHAVVIPYPLQGHVIPAVHLALRLAARGFAVTFVNTESVHRQITSSGGRHGGGGGDDIFAGAGGGAIRYELVSDGFPLGFDRSLNHDQYMEGVLHVLPAHVDELLRRVAATATTRPPRASSPTPSSCGRRRSPGSSACQRKEKQKSFDETTTQA